MSFRISSFSVEGNSLKTPEVNLSKNMGRSVDNYFTVVIGNNGTGKSRFISNLIEAFRDIGEEKRREIIDYSLKYRINEVDFYAERKRGKKNRDIKSNEGLWPHGTLNIPSKVIAITTSISDKFSLDSYLRRKQYDNTNDNNKDFYTYLGPRRGVQGASNRALMDRAITTFISNIGDYDYNESYRHIFDYLKYEPVMKLAYEVRRPKNIYNLNGHLSDGDLKEYLRDYSLRRGGIRERSIHKALEEKSGHYWKQLAETYNYIRHNTENSRKRLEFSFMVNFSEENEVREKIALGSHQAQLYSSLEELRRFELVKGPEIRLYKKDGGEFEFSDASSGEASILSTLIALIPSIENNSLLIIDEPEISLHPSWQSRYIELIDTILSNKKGCHIVIATHSHFLISDLPLDRSHIVHFKAGKHSSVIVDYINGETHGLSAEDILLNVFDMPSTRNYYLSKDISEALELVADGETNSDRFTYLIASFKRYLPNLKDVDPLKDIIETLLSMGGK